MRKEEVIIMSQAEKTRSLTYDIVIVGVMAVVKIGPIPTPAGPTQIKLGNAFCLLAGMLFGGIRGGLAAGIGSALFDLTNPAFVSSAPFTLVFFFMMGFVSGVVSHLGGRQGRSVSWNIAGAVLGAASYLVLYLGKSMIVLMMAGSDIRAAAIACSTKFITSGINAVIAIVISVPLALICRKALEKAGLGKKFLA